MIPILTFHTCTECPSKQTSTNLGTSYQPPPHWKWRKTNIQRIPIQHGCFLVVFFQNHQDALQSQSVATKMLHPTSEEFRDRWKVAPFFPIERGCQASVMLVICIVLFIYTYSIYVLYIHCAKSCFHPDIQNAVDILIWDHCSKIKEYSRNSQKMDVIPSHSP